MPSFSSASSRTRSRHSTIWRPFSLVTKHDSDGLSRPDFSPFDVANRLQRDAAHRTLERVLTNSTVRLREIGNSFVLLDLRNVVRLAQNGDIRSPTPRT